MPHSTALSTDTIPSFTSEDFEASSIAVAQTVRSQKHHSTVLTIGSRSSMSGAPHQAAVFSFEEQPLPTLPTPDAPAPAHGDGFDSARGSNATPSMASSEATAVPYQAPQSQASMRRTQYYDEQFAYKDHPSSAREKVTREAPVIAELRTNVIINDEYTLTTHLSYHLSTRYQRPESSVAVTIQHSACLCLSGSFQPAYILTVTALPSLIQPSTNKRNAALMQSFMSDVLSVSPDRGIIRFAPIEEENIATNGRTVLAEIEKLERQNADEHKSALGRAMTGGKGQRRSLILKKQKSQDQDMARSNTTRTLKPKDVAAAAGPMTPSANGTPTGTVMLTPRTDSLPKDSPYSEPEPFDTGSGLQINSIGSVVDAAPDASPVDSKIGRSDTKVDRRPSSRGSTKHKILPTLPKDMPQMPPPPPIPIEDDAKSKKLSKRKSIISIFRSKS